MNNELSSDLIENSPLAVLVFDVASRNIVYANPAFRDLIDFHGSLSTVEELLPGFEQEDVVYLQKVFDEFLQGTATSKIDFRYTLKNKKSIWLRLYPSFVGSGNRERIAATIQNITEEVENYSAKDKYANKKNAVLNILAHDLAGPLSIANSLASSLKNRVDAAYYTPFEAIADIITQSYDLIRDLTNREFLETVDVQLVKDRIDVVQKLKEYFEEYQLSQKLTKRTFIFKSSAPAIFMAIDESKFVQIVNNLSTNALKFTHDGGLISISVEEKNDSVLFSFVDNGIGIPEKFKDVLFEQYTPARRKGLQGEPSTGLGMWVVKTIVEWHKGRIWFTSKENEGTSIFFELPKH